MSKSDTWEYDVLKFLFEGKGSTMGYAATEGSTDLWVGLHTADPGDAASTANEGGYAQYDRVAVDRSTESAGWSVTSAAGAGAATVAPVSNIDFPAETATTTGTFTHASIWASSNISSSGCFYVGTISPNINFGNGVTPRLTTGSSITED